jgi:hypothetical protein
MVYHANSQRAYKIKPAAQTAKPGRMPVIWFDVDFWHSHSRGRSKENRLFDKFWEKK